ncbi:hypothetical protein D3C86_2256560 [compost metagenome]
MRSSRNFSTARYSPSLMKIGSTHSGGTAKIHRYGSSFGSQLPPRRSSTALHSASGSSNASSSIKSAIL